MMQRFVPSPWQSAWLIRDLLSVTHSVFHIIRVILSLEENSFVGCQEE